MAWYKLVSQQFLVIFYGISYVYWENTWLVRYRKILVMSPPAYKPPSPHGHRSIYLVLRGWLHGEFQPGLTFLSDRWILSPVSNKNPLMLYHWKLHLHIFWQPRLKLDCDLVRFLYPLPGLKFPAWYVKVKGSLRLSLVAHKYFGTIIIKQ